MMKPKVVLLIFVSGKIVLTGAKVREEIYMAFNQIYSVLVGELLTSFSSIARDEAEPGRIQEGAIGKWGLGQLRLPLRPLRMGG